MTTEIVLPSGQFARIRPPLVRDVSLASQFPPEQFMAALISLTVTLDDERLTVEEVMNMEYGNMLPVYEAMGNRMKLAMKTKDGVA